MRKNSFIILLAATLAFAGCKKQLDIIPEQSVDDQKVLVSGDGATNAILGAYDAIQGGAASSSTATSGDAIGGFSLMAAEFTSDNVRISGGAFPTYVQISNFIEPADNTSVQDHWEEHFPPINIANNVIEALPNIKEGITDQLRNQLRGEALFIRALMHFELLKWYSKFYSNDPADLGVPLLTKAFKTTTEANNIGEIKRATVKEVYDQIVKDLEEASTLLPVSYSTAAFTRGRATVGAANGLLSRIYLYQKQWAKANEKADLVLKNTSLYRLSTTVAEPFTNKNTTEHIFSLQFADIDNPGANRALGRFYQLPPSGRGDLFPSANLLAAYETNDARRTAFIKTQGSNTLYLKFAAVPANSDHIPVVRVAEMYLNKAEALAQLNGVTQEAVDALNAIRTRAGLAARKTGDFASKEALITEILKERRLELALEGHRRFDLLRTGQGLTNGLGNIQIPNGDGRTVFFIPQREIDINPNIIQNKR